MMYYYDEDLEDLEEWEEWEEEEFYDDENGVVEYMYGLDEKKLRNELAPDPRENPVEFSKLGIYKLQNLVRDYKYLLIELGNDVKPNAKLFYTVRFWWVNADRSMKKLVDWAIYGPTSSHYIVIPVNDIVGIYRLKGYHMSSDIFIEYRVDEEISRLGWWRKVLERRFAVAKFTKKDKIEDKSDEKIEDKSDEKKEQGKKPSKPSGTQKPKEQTSKPQKPENKPKKDEDITVGIQPVQPTSQRIPMQWIILGLGIVGALILWLKIKNRR